MAEALLHCVVRGVANKAADALVQTVTGMCGVEADRRKLERQLLAVQCKLADAEAKSKTNQYVKRWMKDFRTVAYQADDVLDGFLYEALRRQIQIGDSKTRKVLSHFTSHSPLAFRYTMSRKLNNVLEKINELVEEMNKFGLESQAEAPRVLYPQTHSGLDMDTEPVGREDDKGVVMRLLLEQEDQQKVQVLPIFGMGGLGKTTLAKMVYNDCKIQQHFQLRMWHCASGNFEAIALVKSIIELATKETCDLPHTMELLRGRLQQVIGAAEDKVKAPCSRACVCTAAATVDWNAWNRCAAKGSSEAVVVAFDGNDDLVIESLDKAEDGWHCGRVCCADGEVNGEGVPTGDGHEVRGVAGVDVEDGELEVDAEVGGEAGEVLVDELQFERVVPRQRP
ncbi:hypothetical protein ACQ4PT_008607 [Festuca glaucescens]